MSSAETIALDSTLNNPDVPAVSTINEQVQEQSLRSSVEATMENYFRHLDGQSVTDVYDMVLQEVEAPLLEIVMKNTRQNQTKAAELLGLNRGTLRKKLKRYSLL
ncbi:MAG: Fis family transcriptional regulator [Pseudohongiellaceae bacterium]|jgi:Fis family transcriptional regulator